MSLFTRNARRNTMLRSLRRTAPLRLESLEDRCVPATFMVTNIDDDGVGSLRQAIFNANANPADDDIIQFASTATGMITLTSGELSITGPVDLQGPGAGILTVSGGDESRVFSVSANAIISKLTITEGSAITGGGIYNSGTLTVECSTITKNSASSGGYKASDGSLNSTAAEMTITVTAVNDAPAFAVVSGQQCTQTQLTAQVAATDPDVGDTRTYSVSFVSKTGAGAVNNPTGFSIDSNGLFHWAPGGGQLGRYTFKAKVTDGGGLFAEQDFVTTLGVVDGVLTIVGSSGDDRITIKPTEGDASELTVRINEHDYGYKLNGKNNPDNPYTDVSHIHVCGLAGDDQVSVNGAITIDATLEGGAGHDKLKGGEGNDILLGGSGADLLTGDKGRDLLIGGTGADRIVGNADDDVLIAGVTAYDDNHQALGSIMHDWVRLDLDNAARIALLRDSNQRDGMYLGAATVGDDDSQDILTGNAGQDWFFFNNNQDNVTDLHHEAFVNDLEFING